MKLDHEPDYHTIVVSEIQPRLPEGVEIKTCDDVRDLNVECCETGHNSYPQGHRKTGQRWSRQNRSNGCGPGRGCFTPTLPVEASLFSCTNSVDQFQYVVRMREAMEHGGNGSTIAEKLTPLIDRSIRQAKCWRAHSGALRFPASARRRSLSIIRSDTETYRSMHSLRVASMVASAKSSSSLGVSG
jgi:hypothetical protein